MEQVEHQSTLVSQIRSQGLWKLRANRHQWPPNGRVWPMCWCWTRRKPGAGNKDISHVLSSQGWSSDPHHIMQKCILFKLPCMLLLALALWTMDLCCKRLQLSTLTILWNFRASECNLPSQLSASDHFFSLISLCQQPKWLSSWVTKFWKACYAGIFYSSVLWEQKYKIWNTFLPGIYILPPTKIHP